MTGVKINQDYVDSWILRTREIQGSLFELDKTALRLIVSPPIKEEKPNTKGERYIKRKASFFNRPKKILPAPRILQRVRDCFNWPTCNTLVTKYFPRYPHVTWWEKAFSMMITHARVPNIKYLLACLETVKQRSLALLTGHLSPFPRRPGRPTKRWGRRYRSPWSLSHATQGKYEHLVHR